MAYKDDLLIAYLSHMHTSVTITSYSLPRTLNVCSRTIRRRLDSFGLQRYTMIDDTELERNIREILQVC